MDAHSADGDDMRNRTKALAIAAALSAIADVPDHAAIRERGYIDGIAFSTTKDPAQSKPRRERNTGAAKARRQAKRRRK